MTSQPKYIEIVDYIVNNASKGTFKKGSRLPSIRELATQFECSKATVIRAFDELEDRHIIYSVPQSGYYMVDSLSKKTDSVSQLFDLIDFSAAAPEIDLLPYKDFQHCINQAIDLHKDILFNYSDTQGLPSLRKTLSKQLMTSQVFKKPDDIFITSGSQQALYLLAVMPFPNGKTNILVEQPVYSSFLKILELNGITAVGISRYAEGFDTDQLENLFKTGNIKFFYTIPRFHNPTGYSLSNIQKKEIARLACKYNVYIVEDDYLADLDQSSKNDPVMTYDEGEKIIYIKSFSKTLLPGLRIGYVILPRLLHNKFLDYKRCMDINSSVLSQGALDIYFDNGMYEAHIDKARMTYVDRMKHLENALERHKLIKSDTANSSCGFFKMLELPEHIDAKILSHKLWEKNVVIKDAGPYYLQDFYKQNHVRISIFRTDKSKIDSGIKEIAAEIDNMNRSVPVKKKNYPDF
ncbi:MAG: PLP-dependent aminotransferase family protein [Bacillota bacterium]